MEGHHRGLDRHQDMAMILIMELPDPVPLLHSTSRRPCMSNTLPDPAWLSVKRLRWTNGLGVLKDKIRALMV